MCLGFGWRRRLVEDSVVGLAPLGHEQPCGLLAGGSVGDRSGEFWCAGALASREPRRDGVDLVVNGCAEVDEVLVQLDASERLLVEALQEGSGKRFEQHADVVAPGGQSDSSLRDLEASCPLP